MQLMTDIWVSDTVIKLQGRTPKDELDGGFSEKKKLAVVPSVSMAQQYTQGLKASPIA